MSVIRFNSNVCTRIVVLTTVIVGLQLNTAMAQTNVEGKTPIGVTVDGTTLFGTAIRGGANGSGTIWSLDTGTGAFTNLHDFGGVAEGTDAWAVASSGTSLIGISAFGGTNDSERMGNGTVWSLDTSAGAFTKIHDFANEADGAEPRNIALYGTSLYGTTGSGGAHGDGTLWSLDTETGDFTNLHDFDRETSGASPAGIVLSGQTIYGTTAYGGAANGVGTIWSLDTSTGAFTQLHGFTLATDGASPDSIVMSGTRLYGTAGNGGANGNGTVWTLDTNTGAFTNLHDFGGDIDGAAARNVTMSGTSLYGTAVNRGAHDSGTIWSLDTNTGDFTRLHHFDGENDGGNPYGLALSGTSLYGTASRGGANHNGTIWSFDTHSNTFTNLHDFSANSDPPFGKTFVFDDGQAHIHTEDAERVIVASASTLDLRANVREVDVDNATLLQNGGAIRGVIEETPGLTLRNGANATLNSGTVTGVDMDAANLVLDGGSINSWSCDSSIIIRNESNLSLNSGNVGSAGPGCPSLRSTDSNVQLNGAHTYGVILNGSSTALIAAGSVREEYTAVVASDTSSVTVTGGLIAARDRGISIGDSATLQLSGGVVRSASASGESVIEMSGGTVEAVLEEDGLSLSGTSRLTMTGGSIRGSEDGVAIRVGGSAAVELSGGVVEGGGIYALDDSFVEMSGGTVKSEAPSDWHELPGVVSLWGASRLKIVGGEFDFIANESASHIFAGANSHVEIHGSDFNFPFHEPIESLAGVITGALSDGNPIDWAFQRDETATIVLLPLRPGDYNVDGVLDVADINLQAKAMMDTDPNLAKYDENDDGLVDQTDRLIWVHDHAATWIGDANLDGEFNSGDLVAVFETGEYEDSVPLNSGWAEGDWNGDGDFTTSDLVTGFATGGYEQGPRNAVKTIPEPTSALLFICSLTGVLMLGRQVDEPCRASFAPYEFETNRSLATSETASARLRVSVIVAPSSPWTRKTSDESELSGHTRGSGALLIWFGLNLPSLDRAVTFTAHEHRHIG